MKLLENYNSARQKYGERIVKELSDVGIPPQYLLSACRFFQKGIDIKDIKSFFRQWMEVGATLESQDSDQWQEGHLEVE